ncbi:hypothetical protein GCM10010449_27750 [Streptomyces rectiviolaceus]|uniref:Uncharacterized protein n=1 Tax=Streptomyces rectiviolaceus TaxID=332591 RepID=A0ABP6MET4_9ACTN
MTSGPLSPRLRTPPADGVAGSTEPVARAVERLGGGVVRGLAEAVRDGDGDGLALCDGDWDRGRDGERDGEAVVGGSVGDADAVFTARVGTSGSDWSRCGLSGESRTVASTATATTATTALTPA